MYPNGVTAVIDVDEPNVTEVAGLPPMLTAREVPLTKPVPTIDTD